MRPWALIIAGCITAIHALVPINIKPAVNPVTGDLLPIRCGTQEVYDWRVANNLTTRAEKCQLTRCDDPAVRDGTSTDPIFIRVAYNVVNNAIGQEELDKTISAFQSHFAKVAINMETTSINFVEDTRYGECIPKYGDNNDWLEAIQGLKKAHSVDVGGTLNVLVTCQDKGTQGTLLGIGTFPWDSIATTSEGGLWMNAVAMAPEDATLAHEAGHCLGLWHTFHGVDEVDNCAPGSKQCGFRCCEHPHAESEKTTAPSNMVGDLCSDTAAQPLEYKCSNPEGDACDMQPWTEFGNVDFKNFMGYAMLDPNTGEFDHCQDKFSPQQTSRMHCYLQNELKGWQI